MRRPLDDMFPPEKAVKKDCPVRVCILTQSYFPLVGGGETYTRNVGIRLKKLGMSVFVITRRRTKELKRYEEIDGVPVYRLPPVGMYRFGKYVMLPFAAFQLLTLRRHYDVILVSNFKVLGLAAVPISKMLGKKCILRSGICGELSGSFAAPDGSTFVKRNAFTAVPLALRTAILKRADAFISNCYDVSRELKSCGVRADRIALLPGGVDTGIFHPVDEKEKIRMRCKLGLPADRLLVGYSGKLNRGKGLELLIEAVSLLRKEHSDIELVLIGGGQLKFLSQEAELRALIDRLGLSECVTITGYVNNVQEYLNALDAFVFPSCYEALSNALLEAMASGLPCVATRVGGNPDIVEDKRSGLLIEPGSVEAIAEAVTQLLNDREKAAEWGRNASARIRERYGLDMLSQKHFDFISDLWNEPRPSKGEAWTRNSFGRSTANAVRLGADIIRGGYPDFVYGRRPREIPVFCLHGVTPELFEKQLGFIKRNGYETLTADAYYEAVTGRRTVSDKSIVLTFDDGWGSLWSVGLPLLKKYGIRIVSFLISGMVTTSGVGPNLDDLASGDADPADVIDRDRSARPFLSWDEVRLMHESGLVDFQSHSLTHGQIPCSSEIVDFMRPGLNTKLTLFQMPDWLRNANGHAVLGRPLYRMDSKLAGCRRYVEDAESASRATRYVTSHGGELFFGRRAWRQKLSALYKNANRNGSGRGRYATDDERRAEIRHELCESKRLIEAKLPGKTVRHFAFPWNRDSRLTSALSWEAGYVTNFTGKVSGKWSGARWGEPTMVARVGGSFLFTLPGEGRQSIGAALWTKARKRLGGRPRSNDHLFVSGTCARDEKPEAVHL